MKQIDPQTHMGAVTLAVADRERSRRFYRDIIGLRVLADESDLLMGVGELELLRLREVPGAQPSPRAAGLYHFALLVPTRAALAQALRHYGTVQAPFVGFADHGVSEAIYLQDPDGHGIEVYRDRPRDEWSRSDGTLNLITERLDLESLLDGRWEESGVWSGLEPGTAMGHVHLQVRDLTAARRFYCDVLGFGQMADYPGAAFVSAGGYHHHLGLNVWAGAGADPAPAGAARLLRTEIVLPTPPALDQVRASLTANGVAIQTSGAGLLVRDPSQIELFLTVKGAPRTV